jgi:alpha-glucuronidase
MYEEVLRADTQQPGGTGRATVARILDGSFYRDGRVTMMAGVANVGSERNWSGSHFDQANWYVFGRMAWDPELKSEAIAREWVQQTFSVPQAARESIVQMMQGSREAVVNYMTPLGLHHLMATSHHYGPGLWVSELARPEWNPVYYHRADKSGIGFDRSARGSQAVSQYAPAVAARWGQPATTEPELLLWFHHLPWDYKLPSGQALWPGLIAHYDLGVQQVAAMRSRWAQLQGVIDPERFADVAARLKAQERDAQWWRDASIAYFQSVNGLPLPAGVKPPALKLEDYKAHKLHYAP